MKEKLKAMYLVNEKVAEKYIRKNEETLGYNQMGKRKLKETENTRSKNLIGDRKKNPELCERKNEK